MKYYLTILHGVLILSIGPEIYAQGSFGLKTKFPQGITIEYGTGNFADTDEYISKEKYSGTLPYFNVGWTNQHDNYIYQVGFEYRQSSEVENYNVSADILQFSLNQQFLYKLPKFSLFQKDVYIFLGPSIELFLFYNEQNIAVSGFDYAQSFASLFSLGLSSEIFYPLWDNINIESALNFSVLSLGFRMVDDEETNESPAKLLTLFSGINASFSLGARYFILDNFSMKASYLLNVTRISEWDPLLSASDNLIFSLTYGF